MNNKIEGIIHRPFAPPIGKYELSKKSIENINKYVDDTKKDKEQMNEKNHGEKLFSVKTIIFQSDGMP